MNKNLRIAVLLGGDTNEREISLESGRNVVYKLASLGYNVMPVFVSAHCQLFRIDQKLLVRNSTAEIEEHCTQTMRISWNDLPTLVDFVFIGLHGGKGENGATQGALEMLGIPYNGSSVFASALCMDKQKTKIFLAHHGLDVPKGIIVSQAQWHMHDAAWMDQLPGEFPLIVKPHDDGCSVMVSKAKNVTELNAALAAIFAAGKSHAMIEEYVHGMELTIGVVGNETAYALPPSQAVVADGILSIEEKFLPGAGENQTPAPLPPEALTFAQKAVRKAYEVAGCSGYARIDCFYQSASQSPTGAERLVIIEINTLPGLTPATCIFHQAAEVGIAPAEFIELIVQLGLERHTHKAYVAPEFKKLFKDLEQFVTN